MSMPSPYYFAAWTDSGCLLGCDHPHATVISAVVCAQSAGAGAYVVAVEQAEPRQLNEREEREFQLAMYGTGIDRAGRVGLAQLVLAKPILH